MKFDVNRIEKLIAEKSWLYRDSTIVKTNDKTNLDQLHGMIRFSPEAMETNGVQDIIEQQVATILAHGIDKLLNYCIVVAPEICGYSKENFIAAVEAIPEALRNNLCWIFNSNDRDLYNLRDLPEIHLSSYMLKEDNTILDIPVMFNPYIVGGILGNFSENVIHHTDIEVIHLDNVMSHEFLGRTFINAEPNPNAFVKITAI